MFAEKSFFSRARKWVAVAAVAAGSVGAVVVADVVDDARLRLAEGDVAAAKNMIINELESNPKTQQEGTLQLLLGMCFLEEGDFDAARSYFEKSATKGVADASWQLGRLAARDYDFDRAAEMYGRYVSLKTKAKKEMEPQALLEKKNLERMREFMMRVDSLVVLDSINVPRDEFFRQVRLPAASGRLLSGADSPIEESGGAAMVFVSGDGSMALWEQADSVDNRRLYESIRLTDGSWQPATPTDSTINIGNAAYPFMMPDGTMLYFASDGPESLGGYDLFVAARDPSDDTYMMPTNLGMPYNSQYDDFLLAIDEEHNVGWLATDRNSPGGDVTLYIFIPNELRRNVPADDAHLADRASLRNFRDTWPEGEDFSELLATVKGIDPDATGHTEEFRLPMPGGKVYTSFADFHSDDTRELMHQYLEALETYNDTEEELTELRTQYHANRTGSLARRIPALEKQRDNQRENVRRLRSQVIRKELRNR